MTLPLGSNLCYGVAGSSATPPQREDIQPYFLLDSISILIIVAWLSSDPRSGTFFQPLTTKNVPSTAKNVPPTAKNVLRGDSEPALEFSGEQNRPLNTDFEH